MGYEAEPNLEERAVRIDRALNGVLKAVENELGSYHKKHPQSSEFPERFTLVMTEGGVSIFADPVGISRKLDVLAAAAAHGFSLTSVDGVRATPTIYKAIQNLWEAVPPGVRSMDLTCQMVRYSTGVKAEDASVRVMGLPKGSAGAPLMRASAAVKDDGQDLTVWQVSDLTDKDFRMLVPAVDARGAALKALRVMSPSAPWGHVDNLRVAEMSGVSFLDLVMEKPPEPVIEDDLVM